MKTQILTAIAVIAALGVAGSAFAQGESQAARSVFEREVSVPVTYADLNLGSHEGAAIMLERLHHAALNACGASDWSVKDYRWSVAHSSCVRHSMDEAVAQLDAPTVTQLYADRNV